jgi:hypothetical protein
MGYLTINTRSNGVVIISSVITRIFQLCAMLGRSHLNFFNKDTYAFLILCKIFMCQLIVHYLLLLFIIYRCCSFILFIVRLFRLSLFNFCSHSILLLSFTHCFVVQKKRFNSDPGLYSRYFDPAVPVVQEYPHHLCKSINIIHQTAPTLS